MSAQQTLSTWAAITVAVGSVTQPAGFAATYGKIVRLSEKQQKVMNILGLLSILATDSQLIANYDYRTLTDKMTKDALALTKGMSHPSVLAAYAATNWNTGYNYDTTDLSNDLSSNMTFGKELLALSDELLDRIQILLRVRCYA